tara:strand:- start:199 stop:486 length:288 start_codon:yes stop_codon:yes gene_type:complete
MPLVEDSTSEPQPETEDGWYSSWSETIAGELPPLDPESKAPPWADELEVKETLSTTGSDPDSEPESTPVAPETTAPVRQKSSLHLEVAEVAEESE